MLRKQIAVFVSWILSAVIFYNIIGYLVLFCTTDLHHRSMMEELLNKRELTVLKIPNEFLKHHPQIFMQKNTLEYFGGYNIKNISFFIEEIISPPPQV